VTLAWAILLGLGLGLRHATDADHVVAIGTLLHREASPFRAARLAALWGLGHTVTFVALGLLVVIAGLRLPPAFDRVAEGTVAVMLIGLGSWTIVRAWRPKPQSALAWRPVAVGIVHGLGGSAAVALLALTTISSRAGALLYLALFCVGTVIGMMFLTVVLALPLGWTQRRFGEVPRALVVAVSLASVAFGVAVGVRAFV
jgi:high-affinity nickel permease